MEKRLTEKDVESILTIIEVLKDNTVKGNLSFNVLNGLRDFLKAEESEGEEKPKKVFADGKWEWTPKRRAEQKLRMEKFWKDRKQKKEDKRRAWTGKKRKELSRKIKKIWRERKTQHKRKRKVWTIEENKFIRRRLKAGITQKKIAEELGVNLPILKHKIRKLRGKE